MKSAFPYLVDIGITNMCPFGCEFCYQSSTFEGKVGDYYYIKNLAETLRKSGVFEVVFGGGEPTLYKDNRAWANIASVVEAFKSEKFKVGITTKNYNFYKSEVFKKTVENTNSIAISANSLDELEKALILKTEINNQHYDCSVYIQCVLGVQTWDEFKKFIDKCDESFTNLTLLGYKDFGFGKNEKPYDIPDEWIDYVKSKKLKIGADSILINKYRNQLLEAGVMNYYLVGKEGKSSCYIDAVNQVVKPSSFTDEKYDFKMGGWNIDHSKTFIDIFSKF